MRDRSHRRDLFEYSVARMCSTTNATLDLVDRRTTNIPPIMSERPRELLQPTQMSLDFPPHARHVLNWGLDRVNPSDHDSMWS